MKIKWKELIICVAIPLVVARIAGFITAQSMDIFNALEKPPLSPPGWLFPVVWVFLYVFMGVASYLVYTANIDVAQKKTALTFYGVQLVFNFFWSLLFFGLSLYVFSFIWLVVLWVLILLTIISMQKINKITLYLLLPYILWVTFAGYLNIGIAILN